MAHLCPPIRGSNYILKVYHEYKLTSQENDTLGYIIARGVARFVITSLFFPYIAMICTVVNASLAVLKGSYSLSSYFLEKNIFGWNHNEHLLAARDHVMAAVIDVLMVSKVFMGMPFYIFALGSAFAPRHIENFTDYLAKEAGIIEAEEQEQPPRGAEAGIIEAEEQEQPPREEAVRQEA